MVALLYKPILLKDYSWIRMENEFQQNPIRVRVLGVDLKAEPHFYEKETLIFPGHVSDAILKGLHQVADGGKSKAVEEFYGPKWASKLGIGIPPKLDVTGAAEDDIFDIPELEGKEPAGPELTVVKEIKHKPTEEPEKKKKDRGVKVSIVADVHIYPEDRVSEFKEKLSLVQEKLYPFKQHIFFVLDGNAIPMRYKLTTDINVSVDIRRIFNEKGRVMDIPIDDNLFQNKDTLMVEAYDSFTTLRDIFGNFGVHEFYLVNIDEFFQPLIKLLRETIRTDQYQFQLLYYSLVAKFWPMITPEVFQYYILNETEIKDVYPDLMPSATTLRRRYQEEQKILDEKYALLDDAQNKFKNYPEFRKFSPEISLGKRASKDSIMTVAIKSASLELRTTPESKINVRNLFEKLTPGDDMPLVRVRLILHNQPFVITRIKAPSIVENDALDIQRVYEKIKYRLQLTSYNSILIAVRIAEKYRQEEMEHNYVILTIQDNGKYNIKSTWGEEVQMEFQTVYKIIEETINPLLQNINNMGRGVFESIHRLPLIHPGNTEFSSLNMSLFWRNTITQTMFDNLGKMIKEDMASGIIRPTEGLIEAGEQTAGSFTYYMYKGITEYDIHQLERSVNVWNYYEYLTNSKIKQKWQSLFEKGRLVSISHRTTDVKIEIQDLKEKEFQQFYQYIISFLFRAEGRITSASGNKKEKIDVQEQSKKNLLKLLKSRDPELYVFKRFGSDVVYSRICQKDHQPIPYTPEEYARLDKKTQEKAVKYWNFTSKSPMYYLCPNSKYPYMSFITGAHPRGYCLPCCKKTALEGDSGEAHQTKKEHVYNICLTQHVYTEQDTQSTASRYIMNYGKAIEIGRIGKLPDMLDKYLLYNLEDRDLLADSALAESFTLEGKNYSVSELMRVVKHVKPQQVTLAELKVFMEKTLPESNKTWMQLLKNPDIHPEFYNRISNTKLEPLLIHYTELLYNYFILARAFQSEASTVEVKYITAKQLAKSLITEVEGGNIRKPGYYLYGVPQNNVNVMNIGAGFSIASALGITFEKFVESTITILKRREINYYKVLLKGRLARYFDNLEHLMSVMHKLFLGGDITLDDASNINGNSKFTLWNELFIDVAKLCYGKYVIIVDDVSIDITGTSIKSSRLNDNMDLILPEKITSVNDIIPTDRVSEYILLLRKKKKARSFFTSNYLYYPIYIFVPHEFFKTERIEKRIYTQRDEIMKLVHQLISATLGDASAPTSRNEINLNLVIEFLEAHPKITMDRALINSKNMCYAVLLRYQNQKLLLPIEYSHFSNLSMERISREPYTRKEITITYSGFKDFAEELNSFIVKKSEEAGMYKVVESEVSGNELNKREAKILPMYPLLKVDKLLILEKQIIGAVANGDYIYFKNVPVKSMKDVVKSFQKGYQIMSSEAKIHRLLHDPDEINQIITKQQGRTTSRDKTPQLSQAIYDRYLYNLLVLEFISHLDKDRNPALRKKVMQWISQTNFKNADSISKLHDNLNQNLPTEDVNKIQMQINEYLNTHFDKELLQENIENLVYAFDRTTLNELGEISDGIVKLPEEKRAKQMKELRKRVKDIVSEITHLGTPKITESLDNIFTPCSSSESPYCYGTKKSRKLMIPKDRIEDLIDLLVADLCNPLKRSYILSAVVFSNIQEYYHFLKKPGTEIYVKIG